MKTRLLFIIIGLLVAIVPCRAQDDSQSEKTPSLDLHMAVIQNDLKAVQQHIAAGTDLNVKEPDGGSTPLITAATFGRTEAAKALIDAGADLNATNNDGSTALISAAFFCHTEIVRALLDNGADKSLINSAGSDALQAVSVPYEHVKPIYEYIEQALSSLGFQIDYERIEKTRPIIAEMLQ